MYIGLLGGSFHFFHEGHHFLANTIMKRCHLHQIWIFPCINTMKDTSLSINRNAMILNVYKNHITSHCKIPSETFCKHIHYKISTYSFLYHIRNQYPTYRFIWIMGSDCLIHLHKWEMWKNIIHIFPIIILSRAQNTYHLFKSPAYNMLKKYQISEKYCHNIITYTNPCFIHIKTEKINHQSSTNIKHNVRKKR